MGALKTHEISFSTAQEELTDVDHTALSSPFIKVLCWTPNTQQMRTVVDRDTLQPEENMSRFSLRPQDVTAASTWKSSCLLNSILASVNLFPV